MPAGGKAAAGPASVPGSDLRERIQAHYDRLSPLYVLFWGEHLHHGYWEGDESRAEAQEKLVRLLAERAEVPRGARVLDVGCGVGGSARWLASSLGCTVVGLTLSFRQARMARKAGTRRGRADVACGGDLPGEEARITLEAKSAGKLRGVAPGVGTPAIQARGALGGRSAEDRARAAFEGASAGRAWFLQADASGLPVRDASFDAVWILECYEHLEDKRGVLGGLARALRPGGVLALTGWFRGEEVPDEILERDLRPVTEGMLLPPLAALAETARWAEEAGLVVREASDLTSHVVRTWDVCLEIAGSPLARLLLPTLDADSRRFVAAFAAMKRAYASGVLRYGLLAATSRSAPGFRDPVLIRQARG